MTESACPSYLQTKLSRVFAILFAVILLLVAPGLAAQTYVQSTDGAINNTTTCTAPLVRNFSVTGTSFVVADVDLGVFVEHTWRGDLQITLQHPDGTRVQLVNGDINSTSGDHFNVRLNDSGTQVVNTDVATGNHSTAAPPPFANNFIPNNPLAAFNGKSSNGTWRTEICDLYPTADNGNFRHAELYLTAATGADLSLVKTALTPTPASGGFATFRLSVTNAATSPQTANSVIVRDILPAGFSFTSASGTGTYNAVTGDWSVGTIAPGQTRTIDITGTVAASPGAVITNVAQIWSSSVTDPDSVPGNSAPGEDDYSSASFTVAGTRVAGTPPTLTCPNSSVLFNWDTTSWTAGSTSGSYPLGSLGNVDFALTNPGLWLNNAALGGQSPSNQNVVHGGTFEFSLFQLVDLPDQASEAVTILTLPANMHGAQFRIIDVDYAAGQFADRIQVSGELDGATVTPVLTNGVANYVIGNQAFGDGNSNNDQADGTITVTFNTPVDRIIIRYGNHSLSPVNPGQQGIAIHDMTFCNPYTELAATKVSAVITDPINGATNPKFIPGALVEYTIGVSNTGVSPTDSGTISVADIVPANTKFCLASIAGAGPVRFIDGSPASGLTYTYTSLTSATDNLQFSNNGGASWTYTPVADADGCDPAVTHVRVTPSGALAQGRSFSLRMRFRVL